MTSANVTNYRIEKNGKIVLEHSQSHLCYPKWHRLLKFIPFTEYTITPYGLDEEENYWEGKTRNLRDFMKQIHFSFSDMKRMSEHTEKQKEILNEWLEAYGDKVPLELKQKTQKAILYSPL